MDRGHREPQFLGKRAFRVVQDFLHEMGLLQGVFNIRVRGVVCELIIIGFGAKGLGL